MTDRRDHFTAEDDVEARLRGIKRGQFASAHLTWHPDLVRMLEALSIKHVFILRDPRDTVVSSVNYFLRIVTDHAIARHLRELPGFDEQLLAVIRGTSRLLDIGTVMRSYQPWLSEPDTCPLRFEDLIGPHGAGDRAVQRDAIDRMARHLELGLSPSQIEHIADRVFSKASQTFFKGRIGSWREHFTPQHKRAFKEIAGPILIELGYERDLDW